MRSLQKRRGQDAELPLLFGWCAASFSITIAKHGKPPGEDVEPGTCPGEIIASHDTSNHKKGDKLQCECTCHGEGRKRYPDYDPNSAPAAVIDDDDEQVVASPAPAPERVIEDVQLPPEPALPTLAQVEPEAAEIVESGIPMDDDPGELQEAPASASRTIWTDDGLERTESKRIHYKNGDVVKMERKSTTKNGREIMLGEWFAHRTDGTISAPEWQLKTAKAQL